MVVVLLRHLIFDTLYYLLNCPLISYPFKYFVKFYSFTLNTTKTNKYDTRNKLCKLHVIQSMTILQLPRFDSNDSMFLKQVVTNWTCKFRTVRIFRGPFHAENVQLYYHKISGTNPIRCKNNLLLFSSIS